MTRRVLAIDGGTPLRTTPLQYGRQSIDEDDVNAVVSVLRSNWLTTGPAVASFERALAEVAGVAHAVAVNSGTAALHAAMFALGVGPGDEVIVPAVTFVATANAAVYQGAAPVFADVDAETMLVSPEDVARKVSPRTRAIVGVDYAGQPCDWPQLRRIAQQAGVALVADACHSLGGSLDHAPVGTLADVTCFSFHPVKHITTAEGGAMVTARQELAVRARLFRNHGITTDHRERERLGTFAYEMVELGHNYRLNDIQAALGESQLKKLRLWVRRRQEIAARYDDAFADVRGVVPLRTRAGVAHARHLYVVRLDPEALSVDRARVHAALRAEGVLANVHYMPVHLHPFYEHHRSAVVAPVAEREWLRLLSLPLFPTMTDVDADDVVSAVTSVLETYAR